MSDTASLAVNTVTTTTVTPEGSTVEGDKDALVQKLATTLLPTVNELVSSTLKAQGVDLQQNAQVYYRMSRLVLRALVAAGTQRMFEDGANKALVRHTLRSSDGWDLFLNTHPDIKAKVEAEQAEAKAALAALLQSEGVGDDEDDGDGGDDGDTDD